MSVLYNTNNIITDGLILYLDPANTKSYNTKNLFENPTDILSWMGSTPPANNATLSRDTTVSSPVGNSPMKMVCNGSSDPYVNSWNSSLYNVSSASQGETFTVSVWAKSASGTTLADCSIYIFDADSSGSWDSSSFSSGDFTVTDTWGRFSFTRTTSWSSTANIQVRIDGPQNGTGTLWWDGMQVERSSTATNFSSGSSTILDVSSNGNNAALSNITYNSDGYFDFNGTSSMAVLTNDTSLNPSYVTLSVWVKFDNVSNNRALIAKRSGTGSGSYWLYVSASNEILFDTYQGSTQNRQTHIYNFSTGTWYNITATYSSSAKVIYVNGSSVNSTSGGNALTSVNTDIGIGRDSYNAQYYLDGKISNVQIYNKGLTAAEVKQNFNALRGRYGI